MRRVPLPLAILLCPAVVAAVWWHGTRDYDFITPPSPTEIEIARASADRQLARPTDLFARPEATGPSPPLVEMAAPPPETTAPAPAIEPGPLEGDPPLDAWRGESGKPAASFINLASQLEAEGQLGWALPAWERAIDSATPDADELSAAINGIRRIRAGLELRLPETLRPTETLLDVAAPADRLQLARRAAQSAAETIGSASAGLLRVTPAIRKAPPTVGNPKLVVRFADEAASDAPSVEVVAPATTEDLENAILGAAFKLVASTLAMGDDLEPVSPPPPGEIAADSIELRISRLAWQRFAGSLAEADSD